MTGEETRTCIDGKQRCSSVVEFMDGKIPFVSPATGEKYWYKKAKPTERGHLCTPAMRSKFDMIQIQAVEYDGVSDEVQRDIFRKSPLVQDFSSAVSSADQSIERVQMGVPLSAPEKLQAIPSELTTWIMELAKKYVFEEGTLGDHIDWDTARGKPFQAIASIIYMCWYVDSRQAVTSTVLKKWLEKSDPVSTAMTMLCPLAYKALTLVAARRRVQEEDGKDPHDHAGHLYRLPRGRLPRHRCCQASPSRPCR